MQDAKRAILGHGDTFEACPDCQYDGGWHIVLQRQLKSKSDHDVKILLRCPKCHTTFDLDLYCSVEHKGLVGT